MNSDFVVSGLVRRGLPEHVAKGFAVNFADESGFDPGVNERNPTVAGSRGGFGLAQWTGPRRTALEQFAADRGVPASDPDAQLDFLVMELQGPESAAARSIMSAPDEQSAAVAVLNDFLRPAPEHRDRRAAKYAGGKYTHSPTQAGTPPPNALAAYQAQMQQPQQNALAALPRYDFSGPEFYKMSALGRAT